MFSRVCFILIIQIVVLFTLDWALYIEILYIYIGGVLSMEATMFLVVAQTGQTKQP